jgi:hypothetical protein
MSRDSVRRNRGTSAAPAIAVAAVLGVVVVAALFFGRSEQPATNTNAAVSEQSSPSSTEATAEPQVAAAPVAQQAEPTNIAEAEVAVATVEPQAALSGAALVEAQIAAGEFGPALDAVQSIDVPAERSRLLMVIAEAQVQAGELEGARSTLGRVAQSNESALAGGGAQADFDQLIELIRANVTNAAWEDEDGFGGNMSPYETGVRVDPHGLLEQVTVQDNAGRLQALGNRAREADLNEDMVRASELRLVSLTRLEREIARRLAAGEPVLETMRQLAGLSQIQYVFVYPEQQEIVIGGPAEGWRYTESGQPVGQSSGRPTLQLDDLVTVLRTFSPDGQGMFNCLIVPRQEGLREVKEFVAKSTEPLRPARVERWTERIQELLGLQDIEVNGVPLDSRVARVIVEADYRMKLIGVGAIDGGNDVPSYFDLLPLTGQTASAPLNALRWWLTMKYEAVLHSPNRDVFEIRGSSVLCRSESEMITDSGERVHTGTSDATNSQFARNFTEHYAEIAARDLVFAELQNIFDLSLVAALLRQQGVAWDLGVFGADGDYRPAQYAPPSTVMSVVNHRVYNGQDVVVQAAGGVRGDLMTVVSDAQIVQETPRLANIADRGRAPELPEGRWWWDAVK